MGWVRLLDERGRLLGIGELDPPPVGTGGPSVVAPRIVF